MVCRKRREPDVLAGNRPDTAPDDPWIRRWEGWVLGQTALPTNWPVPAVAAGRKKKWRAMNDAPKVVFGNAQSVT